MLARAWRTRRAHLSTAILLSTGSLQALGKINNKDKQQCQQNKACQPRIQLQRKFGHTSLRFMGSSRAFSVPQNYNGNMQEDLHLIGQSNWMLRPDKKANRQKEREKEDILTPSLANRASLSDCSAFRILLNSLFWATVQPDLESTKPIISSATKSTTDGNHTLQTIKRE